MRQGWLPLLLFSTESFLDVYVWIHHSKGVRVVALLSFILLSFIVVSMWSEFSLGYAGVIAVDMETSSVRIKLYQSYIYTVSHKFTWVGFAITSPLTQRRYHVSLGHLWRWEYRHQRLNRQQWGHKLSQTSLLTQTRFEASEVVSVVLQICLRA